MQTSHTFYHSEIGILLQILKPKIYGKDKIWLETLTVCQVLFRTYPLVLNEIQVAFSLAINVHQLLSLRRVPVIGFT